MKNTSRRFPVYSSHLAVACFNCRRPLVGEPVDTGFPPQGGQFRLSCEVCRMHTYYDAA